MKKIHFALLGLTLAALNATAVLADDNALLTQMPSGSTISLPVNAFVNAQTERYDLGSVQVSDTGKVDCMLRFEPSNKDRTISGQLQVSVNYAQGANDSYTYNIFGDNSGYRLDGKQVPLYLDCYESTDKGYLEPKIGDLRTYLENKGGTLNVAPPVPFGN